MTAIMHAAINGKDDVMNILLAKGADLHLIISSVSEFLICSLKLCFGFTFPYFISFLLRFPGRLMLSDWKDSNHDGGREWA